MKQQQQQCWDYSFYTSSCRPKFAYVTNPVPPETRHVTNKLHSQGCSCFYFYLYFRHSTCKTQLWETPFCSSLLASSFRLVLLRKELIPHSFIVTFHSYRSSAHHLFLSSRGWLLYSCKRRLFCRHIQHATHCLFEWWTPASSSEAAVCGFCLSISLHWGKMGSSLVILGYSCSKHVTWVVPPQPNQVTGPMMLMMIKSIWKCPWCNGYRHR